MKKLMIAAAIVCAAAFAQASSIDWSFMEQARNSNNPYSLDGFSAYLFKADTWEAQVLAGVTADTFTTDYYSHTADLTKTTGGSGASAWTKWATTSPVVWTDTGAVSGDYYVVLFDGSEYTASEKKAATSYATAQDAHTAAAWTIAATKTPLGAGDFTAVPEPTSGLLLLLGVAGLALRRRRA